jgi:diamine N-acetyltransferase
MLERIFFINTFIIMEIIKATKEHFTSISQIAALTWPATYGHILSEAQYKMMLEWMYSAKSLEAQAENGHQFYILKHDNEFKGFSSCEHNYEKQSTTKLHKLYVLPTAQGMGIGNLLMQNLKQHAIANGSQRILLNVNRFNNAKFFYEKQGFSIIREEDIDIGNGYLMEDYVMEFIL